MLVIAWHVTNTLGFERAALGALYPLAATGWAGVDLFFALSGYLITALLLREAADSADGRFSMPRFYARRALRILPAFAAVMALNYAVVWRFDIFASNGVARVLADHDATQLAAYALLLGNYWGPYAARFYTPRAWVGNAVGVTWSLGVEEHFYLFWPALLRALPLGGRLPVALALCAAVMLLRFGVALTDGDSAIALHTATHYRVDSILWGAVLALYSDTRGPLPLTLRRGGLAVCGVAIASLVATGHLSVVPAGTALGHGPGLTLLAVFSTLLVAEVLASPETWLVRALEWRPLRALGVLSYGLYLVHFWAIDLARAALIALGEPPTATAWIIACAVTLATATLLAAALHALVERPFLRLKRRLTALT
jgi:peptidoglycan/LPS O-acetylase OafA/YrhL